MLETAEEAETQADLPDDAEPLTEPQRKENVGNSTATGKTDHLQKFQIQTTVITQNNHRNPDKEHSQLKNIFWCQFLYLLSFISNLQFCFSVVLEVICNCTIHRMELRFYKQILRGNAEETA